MEKLFFILNPIAGSGRCVHTFEDVKALLIEKGIEFSYVVTEFKNHAVELAKSAIEAGERSIIAVGGDGTVSEVAAGVAGSDAVMGILPFGTGNDFARANHIPDNPADALDVVLKRNVKKVDTAAANGRFFVNVAGFGFDVDVLLNTERYKKRFKGMTPYLFGIIKSLANLKTFHLTIAADGKTFEDDAHIISIGNGNYIGGGMKAVPNADPCDGLLDVCYAKKMKKMRFICALPNYIKGRHDRIKEIVAFKTREITISSDIDSLIDIDGELELSTPLTVKITPAALNMFFPEQQKA